jgi:hypothetical protein
MAILAKIGLVRTVVSILHCGCSDPGSIPGLDMLLKNEVLLPPGR